MNILYVDHGPPKPIFSGFFMVNNMEPLFFMVLGAHIYIYIHLIHIYIYVGIVYINTSKWCGLGCYIDFTVIWALQIAMSQ